MYDLRCESCGAVTEHVLRMANRNQSQDCPECGRERTAHLELSPVHVKGYSRPATRAIFDEREIADSSPAGHRWREEGTTGREGGAGRKLFFHD